MWYSRNAVYIPLLYLNAVYMCGSNLLCVLCLSYILTSLHWTTSNPHCNVCNSPMGVHYNAERKKKKRKKKKEKKGGRMSLRASETAKQKN